ncbi:hypothetical protein [Endozoicomonas ascidiicola]|uniref:hypothetical protein n=1 Tax=Endozoicomonas ascidiicola TaxID=1698521 RepID=UPI0008300388|nr:hypothetical protein [Endozoicomonas ascidiicola]
MTTENKIVMLNGRMSYQKLLKTVTDDSQFTVGVYGDPGCGKSTNAEAMARRFGLSVVLDDFSWPRRRVPSKGVLVLTRDLGVLLKADIIPVSYVFAMSLVETKEGVCNPYKLIVSNYDDHI